MFVYIFSFDIIFYSKTFIKLKHFLSFFTMDSGINNIYYPTELVELFILGMVKK